MVLAVVVRYWGGIKSWVPVACRAPRTGYFRRQSRMLNTAS
jgi:hypothetical protein